MTEPISEAVSCPVCGKLVRKAGLPMHKVRAHEKTWSTRKKVKA